MSNYPCKQADTIVGFSKDVSNAKASVIFQNLSYILNDQYSQGMGSEILSLKEANSFKRV